MDQPATNDAAALRRPVPQVLPPEDPSLGDLVRVLKRHRWVLLGIVGGTVLLAFLWTLVATPRYSAEALVLIEPKDSSINALDEIRGLDADLETVRSQALMLSSRSLADRVVRRLALDQDPEFTRGMKDDDGAERIHAKVVDRFIDRLTVQPEENSRIIAVSFSAEQPQKSADIVNAVTDEYLLAGLEAKFQTTQKAGNWLGSRVADLQDKVAAAEEKVEELRRRYGLVAGNSGELSAQELGELNTQLILARAARAEAQARLGRVQTLSRSGNVATASEVLNSPLIQRLREQEAELQRRVAELSSELGERHPRMLQLRAEAADLQAKIDSEVARIIAGLRNEVSVAAAREAAIQGSLTQTQTRTALGNEKEIELRAAEREAEASRSLLAALLGKQKEALAQQDLESQQADARVVAAATPPVEPSFPRRGVVVGLALLASLILGAITVLVRELLDGGFRSGEQIEQFTGISSLGFIPTAPLESAGSLFELIRSRPRSAFGEALRTLNWSISLASPDRPSKLVLVTSTEPSEGKTSVATSLALVQAQAGQRVLLIDADTRRPAVHEVMNLEREPGLLDVLSGRVRWKDAIKRRDGITLDVLPAGTPTPNTPTVLASKRMDDLLAELASQFDLVILDSPPIMAASDARILAQKADATVVVVRWGRTRREAVRHALHLMASDGTRIAGALLNLVDAKRHAQYSYGDSGAYAGALEKYYAD